MTPGTQELLLQALVEKEAHQALQGDLDYLVLQVPQEDLLRVVFLTPVSLEIKDLLAPVAQEDPLDRQGPLGALTFCTGIQETVVCQALQVPVARQAPQDPKASQDVMGTMARKDQWGSRGHRGHMDFQGHLERRVYLALQVEKGPLGLQVTEGNRGHLQIWMPAPESRGFLGYQAQEDQKEPWGPPEGEALREQGAKESPGWMAGGARMASQGRLGLRDTKGTREKPAALEHQDLLAPLGIPGPKGSALDTSVASSWFSTVRRMESPPAPRACPGSGRATVCSTLKDRREHTIRTSVWRGLASRCLAHCPSPTATSTKCATTPGGTTSPTGWPAPRPCP